MFGLLTGLSFAVNMLFIKLMMTKYEFPPLQLNYDVNFCQFLIYFPIWIFDKFYYGTHYELIDLSIYFMSNLSLTLAATFLTLAIKYGMGGVINCFENLKIPWHVLIIMAASGGK